MSARCPFPDKDKLTKAEAQSRAAALNRRRWRTPVYPYRCPAGGHHHVGRRRALKRKAW